jgi:hypothetical protein
MHGRRATTDRRLRGFAPTVRLRNEAKTAKVAARQARWRARQHAAAGIAPVRYTDAIVNLLIDLKWLLATRSVSLSLNTRATSPIRSSVAATICRCRNEEITCAALSLSPLRGCRQARCDEIAYLPAPGRGDRQ